MGSFVVKMCDFSAQLERRSLDEFKFVLTSSCVLCEHVITVHFAPLKC